MGVGCYMHISKHSALKKTPSQSDWVRNCDAPGGQRVLVLLSQELPSPFVLGRLAQIFLPKR